MNFFSFDNQYSAPRFLLMLISLNNLDAYIYTVTHTVTTQNDTSHKKVTFK